MQIQVHCGLSVVRLNHKSNDDTQIKLPDIHYADERRSCIVIQTPNTRVAVGGVCMYLWWCYLFVTVKSAWRQGEVGSSRSTTIPSHLQSGCLWVNQRSLDPSPWMDCGAIAVMVAVTLRDHSRSFNDRLNLWQFGEVLIGIPLRAGLRC